MLNLVNRDKEMNWRMLKEFDEINATGNLFVPDFLAEDGKDYYPSLVRDAVLNFDEEWLAEQLLNGGWLRPGETVAGHNGVVAQPVPATTIRALARGEFNRLYCRAVCRRALEQGETQVVVYQADEVTELPAACAAQVGRRVGATGLFDGLGSNTLDECLSLPSDCPVSVLSVHLP
jgi:hypothetical protein